MFLGAETRSPSYILNSECLSSMYQPASKHQIPLNQSGSTTNFPTARYTQFACLNYFPISDFEICHMCATASLNGQLHLDTRSESSFLSDGFRNWEKLYAKLPTRQLAMSQTCSYIITELGHIDEQLKERLKIQKEENRICLQKISQSKPILIRKGTALCLCKGKQTRSPNSSSSSF